MIFKGLRTKNLHLIKSDYINDYPIALDNTHDERRDFILLFENYY
jgi:hypothetical protein